jgi:hypothetical protein
MKTPNIQHVFKLMIGTSALIASTAFFINTIHPVQASEFNNITNNSISKEMEVIGDYVYFVDAGYMYVCKKNCLNEYCKFSDGKTLMGVYSWVGNKFIFSIEGLTPQTIGGKFKLP